MEMEVYWLLHKSRCIGNLRGKATENRRKTKSHANEAEQPRRSKGRTAVRPFSMGRASLHHRPCAPPRAAHGGLWPARSRRFLNSALWPLLNLDLGRWIFMYRAYFAALLDLHAPTSFSLDSTHIFLLKTWLESYKSAINTQQAKTKRKWRKYA